MNRTVKLSDFETTATRLVDAGKIPGVVAMVADESRALYSWVTGFVDIEKQRQLHVDDVFFIASMTKIVTALACVQLVEQGRVDLEEDASAIVPKMVAKVLTGFDVSGEPVLREPKRKVTVRHLLTHTSGQTTDVWNPNTIRYIAAMKLPPVPGCKLEAFMTPLVFDLPGQIVPGSGNIVEQMGASFLIPAGNPSAAFQGDFSISETGRHFFCATDEIIQNDFFSVGWSPTYGI